MAERPTFVERLLRQAPLVLALVFLLVRLPLLAIGWRQGEATFLLGADGDLAARIGRGSVGLWGEPLAASTARTLALAGATLGTWAWLVLLRRLVGRRSGPLAALTAGALVAAAPFLDAWLVDVAHLGDLLALAALAWAGERVLTHKLRGGPWRLGLAALSLGLSTLSGATAWVSGPFVVLLALLAFPNPASPQAAARKLRGRQAALLATGTWVLVLALAPQTAAGPGAAAAAGALLLLPWLTRAPAWPPRLRTACGLALLLTTAALALWWSEPIGPVAFLAFLLALPMCLPAGRGGAGILHVVAQGLALVALTGGCLLARWELGLEDRTTVRTLAAIEAAALHEARTQLNSNVLVLDPYRSLPEDLPALLEPPFRSGRIPAVLLHEPDGMALALAGQDPDQVARRSLVVVSLEPVTTLEIGPSLRVARGWTGTGDLTDGLPGTPTAPGTWTFDPPLPQHAFGAIEVEVPSQGLTGRLVLLTGDGLEQPEPQRGFDLDLPPVAPGQRIQLLLGTDNQRLLGAPACALTFEGERGPETAPRLVRRSDPPSLLLPGADHELDLRQPAPELQAWYPPALLRPNAFRLDLELESPDGLFDLSTGGQVPPGPPGDLRLRPVWLDRTDRWRGPVPGSEAAPWRDFLDLGLLQRIRRAAPAGEGRWRLRLFWPGGHPAGATPWAPITWRAQPPSP